MDGLSHADQGEFSLSGFDTRGAHRPRPRVVLGLRATGGHEGDSGMAIVLLQEPDGRTRATAGARSVHSADEAQEHAATSHGRGADHPPRPGVLRVVRRILLRLRATTGVALGTAVLGGCMAPPDNEKAIRLWTDDY